MSTFTDFLLEELDVVDPAYPRPGLAEGGFAPIGERDPGLMSGTGVLGIEDPLASPLQQQARESATADTIDTLRLATGIGFEDFTRRSLTEERRQERQRNTQLGRDLRVLGVQNEAQQSLQQQRLAAEAELERLRQKGQFQGLTLQEQGALQRLTAQLASNERTAGLRNRTDLDLGQLDAQTRLDVGRMDADAQRDVARIQALGRLNETYATGLGNIGTAATRNVGITNTAIGGIAQALLR